MVEPFFVRIEMLGRIEITETALENYLAGNGRDSMWIPKNSDLYVPFKDIGPIYHFSTLDVYTCQVKTYPHNGYGIIHADSVPRIKYIIADSLRVPTQSHDQLLSSIVQELQLSPHVGRIFEQLKQQYGPDGLKRTRLD